MIKYEFKSHGTYLEQVICNLYLKLKTAETAVISVMSSSRLTNELCGIATSSYRYIATRHLPRRIVQCRNKKKEKKKKNTNQIQISEKKKNKNKQKIKEYYKCKERKCKRGCYRTVYMILIISKTICTY